MGRPKGDLYQPGHRFGKLVLTHDDGYVMHVTCDCGRSKVVKRGNLIHGHTKSCGCERRRKAKETGQANAGKQKNIIEIPLNVESKLPKLA